MVRLIVPPSLSHKAKRFSFPAIVTVTLVLMIYYTFSNEEYSMNQHLDEEELPRVTNASPKSEEEIPLSKEELDRLELSTPEGLKEKNRYFPILAKETVETKGNLVISDEYLLNQQSIVLRNHKKEPFYKISHENYHQFPKLTKPESYQLIQTSYFNDGGRKNQTRLDRIAKAFDNSWGTYTKYGFGHDEVLPLSHTPEDPFNGWAATMIDSLDTLILMGRKQEFQKALKFVSSMNFKQSYREEIPIFENVIRVLGGLISAYEFTQEDVLLKQAKDLAELLMEAFDTPNGMPLLYYKWQSQTPNRFASTDASLAEVGSLSLEFSRLTQLTKDNKYFDAITRITNLLERSKDEFLIKGLYTNKMDISGCRVLTDTEIEQGVHLNNPKVIKSIRDDQYVYCLLDDKVKPSTDQHYGIGGLADSFYEYMPKMFHLLRGAETKYTTTYKSMYLNAIKVIKSCMVFQPKIPDNENILFVSSIKAEKRGEEIIVEQELDMQHLTCFAGGMFAMGSRLFDIPEDLEIAENITLGCYEMYKRMKIMPEVLWVDKSRSPSDKYDEKERLEIVADPLETGPVEGATESNGIQKRGLIPEPKPTLESVEPPKITILDREPFKLPIDQQNIQGLPNWLNKIDSKYILRPEAIESVFYMYRITGEKKWREMGWEMWENIEKYCATTNGEFASIMDITKIRDLSAYRTGGKIKRDAALDSVDEVDQKEDLNENFADVLESFWFSETLKYFYLLFEDISVWSLDEYVYNTEAHPFKLAGESNQI